MTTVSSVYSLLQTKFWLDDLQTTLVPTQTRGHRGRELYNDKNPCPNTESNLRGPTRTQLRTDRSALDILIVIETGGACSTHKRSEINLPSSNIIPPACNPQDSLQIAYNFSCCFFYSNFDTTNFNCHSWTISSTMSCLVSFLAFACIQHCCCCLNVLSIRY